MRPAKSKFHKWLNETETSHHEFVHCQVEHEEVRKLRVTDRSVLEKAWLSGNGASVKDL